MKRIVAGSITVVLFAGVLLLARCPATPPPTKDADTPENCVQRMFAAAERGEVAAYLDCFTGAERARLDQQLADQSRDAFGESLSATARPLKGHAVFAADKDQRNDGRTQLTVERVYANRTERQSYYLSRDADGWRIAGVETARAYQPPAPYGTPVFELPVDRSGSPDAETGDAKPSVPSNPD